MKVYGIYQIKNFENCNYPFRSYDYAQRHGFNLNDYEFVYGDILEKPEIESRGLHCVLEYLFYTFNVDHPADFKGHSLSTSDIVEVDGVKYYCDNAGWKEVC